LLREEIGLVSRPEVAASFAEWAIRTATVDPVLPALL